MDPKSSRDKVKLDALVKYVNNGGSLLILGSNDMDMIDPTRDSINLVLKNFGIRMMKNGTDDPTNRKGCSCTPIIHNLAKHSINEGVNSIILYKPASLEIKGDAIAIARGDNDTFSIGSEPIGGENVILVANL